MAQYSFGSGDLFAVPTMDASGSVIVNPTPIQFAALQEVSVDYSGDIKELYGENSFPIDVARGKVKISVKAKSAQIFGALYASCFFGSALSTGQNRIITNLAGTVTTGAYTVTLGGATFVGDLGVKNSQNVPLTRVSSAPANANEYSVNTSTGAYTFHTSNNSQVLFFSYIVSDAAIGKTLTVTNLPMGYIPEFSLYLDIGYKGKNGCLIFDRVVSSKLGFATKLDDHVIPDFDMSVMALPNGAVSRMSFSE